MLEASVIEPATPVEEEPEAASRHLSLTRYFSVKAMARDVEVKARVPKEDVRPLLCMCRLEVIRHGMTIIVAVAAVSIRATLTTRRSVEARRSTGARKSRCSRWRSRGSSSK